jgi:radical SAM superfamily enzyme YgiQ (UPF0313 family)
MRKSFKEIEQVEEAIKKVEDYGIYFHPSLIFGFDDDTKDIFEETVEFLWKNKISSASMHILTPYPGTLVYDQFKQEGRLITEDWKYYDHSTAVFRPKNMSPRELYEGRLWARKEFTKFSSILRRLPYHLDKPHYHLGINIGLNRTIRSEIKHFPELAASLYADQAPGKYANSI